MPEAAKTILIVEDSMTTREMAALLLREAGYEVIHSETAEAALPLVKTRRFSLMMLDHELPGMSGLEFLQAARAFQPDTPAIFVAGSLDLELAVRISHERVAGIFTKPVDPRTLLRKVAEAVHDPLPEDRATHVEPPSGRTSRNALAPLIEHTPHLSARPAPPASAAAPRSPSGNRPAITDSCEPFARLGGQIAKVCDFRSVLLLQGQAGSPFAAVARDIVARSAFADGPFLECSREKLDVHSLLEILANLLVSETPGTLLLTGIEDYTPDQISILVQLLGGRGPFMPFAQRFRVIVGATARLAQMAEDGQFDDSLFYRLGSLMVTVPALAEMRGDIVPLARFFLEHEAHTAEGGPTTVAPEAAAWLEAQPWPGDCEELRQLVVSAARCQTGGALTLLAIEQAAQLAAAGQTQPPLPEATPAARPALPPLLPILVVDDSAAPRETTELALREAGYSVVTHDNAESALLDVKARRFALFILDHELPGMSGLEFLRAARAYQADTPAIFVAGSLNLHLVSHITRIGVSGIFTKPVDPRALISKVSEILAGSGIPERAAASRTPFVAAPSPTPTPGVSTRTAPPSIPVTEPRSTPSVSTSTASASLAPQAAAPAAPISQPAPLPPSPVPEAAPVMPLQLAPLSSASGPVAPSASSEPATPVAPPPTPPAPAAPRPPRVIVRKQPGSYDFSKRLQATLGDEAPPPAS